MYLEFKNPFILQHELVYCEKVCSESRMAAEQRLLDLVETIIDTFRHTVSLLSFNEVCEIIVHSVGTARTFPALFVRRNNDGFLYNY